MVAEGVPFSDVLGMRSPIRVCGEEGDIKAASAMHYTRAGQWSCFRTGTTMAPIDTCAAGGGQRQGKWDKGGGRGPHTHQGCQSPIELVVGVSMGTGVGHGSAKWRFSAGEGGRPSLLQGLGKGPTGKVRIGRSVCLKTRPVSCQRAVHVRGPVHSNRERNPVVQWIRASDGGVTILRIGKPRNVVMYSCNITRV